MQRELTAGIAGVVDEVLEAVDRNRGWTAPFRNVTDWARVLIGGGSALMILNNQMAPIAEAALHSETALAVKSVSRLTRTGAFGGAMRSQRYSFVPQARRAALGAGVAAAEDGAGAQAQAPASQTEGFKEIRIH